MSSSSPSFPASREKRPFYTSFGFPVLLALVFGALWLWRGDEGRRT